MPDLLNGRGCLKTQFRHSQKQVFQTASAKRERYKPQPFGRQKSMRPSENP